MLEKTMTLMSLSTKTKKFPLGTIPFDCVDDGEKIVRRHQLFLEQEVWEEMDNPETISVTIEPGDRLNG